MADSVNAPDVDFPSNIGRPARGALLEAGYTRLEQLASVREADLKKLHGMGPKALGFLGEALAVRGLSFAQDFPVKLAEPACRALADGGYTTLEQLDGVPLSKIKQLHGMGPSAIKALSAALAAKGLAFAKE